MKSDTLSSIFWERIEPKTEGGFPDTHFVIKNLALSAHREGTVEFKFCKTKQPNLKSLLEPSQKPALINYFEAGGRRRFALVCNILGDVFFYDTREFYLAITKDGSWSLSYTLVNTSLSNWLVHNLGARH